MKFDAIGLSCCHCGFKIPIGDATSDFAARHVAECPKHPMRLLEAEVKRLREEACRYYYADGTFLPLGSPEEVIAWRIDAAKELVRLRAAVGRLEAELREAQHPPFPRTHPSEGGRE